MTRSRYTELKELFKVSVRKPLSFHSRWYCPQIYNAFSHTHRPAPGKRSEMSGCGEGVRMADWQPARTSWPAVVHSPATCNSLHPGGTSHERKWGVSWLKQCRGHCWWKTSEQEFKGAAWQECNGMTGAKGVEHATCISSWRTVQGEVKRLSCFAYDLRKEDSAKEDRRNQK